MNRTISFNKDQICISKLIKQTEWQIMSGDSGQLLLPGSFTLHSVQSFDLLFQCYQNVTFINRPFTVTDQTSLCQEKK